MRHATLALVGLLAASAGCSDNVGPTTPARRAVLEVTLPRDSIIFADSVRAVAVARDRRGREAPAGVVAWSSSDTLVATVDDSGVVRGMSEGTATITARYRHRTWTHEVRVALHRVPTDVRFDSVSVGSIYHACGLTAQGAVYCWGYRRFTGRSVAPDVDSVPQRIAGGRTYTQVSTGDRHSCAVATDGTVDCWGVGATPSLFDPTPGELYAVEPAPLHSALRFREVVAGFDPFTCALTAAEEPYCWGYGALGALGRPTTSSSDVGVERVSDAHLFTSVSASELLACGLERTGAIYCWGNLASLVATRPAGTPTWQPLKASGDLSFVSFSVGPAGVCGVTAAGDGYCWGNNSQGGLGIGNTTNTIAQHAPQRVLGNIRWKSIVTGGVFGTTCGLAVDGALYCWGSPGPDAGYLGRDHTRPQRVGPTRAFTAVDVGWTSVCAIATTGETYCWGKLDALRY